MDKFEQKDDLQRTLSQLTIFPSLQVGSVKDKLMNLFKTNTTKNYSKTNTYQKCEQWWKETKETKNKKISEDNIIRNIRNTFRLKKRK